LVGVDRVALLPGPRRVPDDQRAAADYAGRGGAGRRVGRARTGEVLVGGAGLQPRALEGVLRHEGSLSRRAESNRRPMGRDRRGRGQARPLLADRSSAAAGEARLADPLLPRELLRLLEEARGARERELRGLVLLRAEEAFSLLLAVTSLAEQIARGL